MGIVIGMDEAGYGPNLGPLVIGTSAWSFDGHPVDVDLWSELEEVITQAAPKKGDLRLHVADSKDVYNPSRGIGSLERTALAALAVAGHRPTTFSQLRRAVMPDHVGDEPWFDNDIELPIQADPDDVSAAADRLAGTLQARGLRLEHIRCDVVLTQRFNDLVREHDSKGVALSRTSISLLRSIWDPDGAERTYVIADKHGGRNRYDELLEDAVGDSMIFRLQEGREKSVYRVNATDLIFRTKAEQHLPVALASIVAKYVREVAMELFNGFWCGQVPDLKPTKGYPVDAARFRDEIAATAVSLGLSEESWWRSR